MRGNIVHKCAPKFDEIMAAPAVVASSFASAAPSAAASPSPSSALTAGTIRDTSMHSANVRNRNTLVFILSLQFTNQFRFTSRLSAHTPNLFNKSKNNLNYSPQTEGLLSKEKRTLDSKDWKYFFNSNINKSIIALCAPISHWPNVQLIRNKR